jgi:hypothetical protein
VSEHDRNLAAMDEADRTRHQRNQALMQEAIDAVGQTAQGRDVQTVTALLVEALAARGIHDQPPRWLDAVATELVAGGRYLEDASAAVADDEDRGTGAR